MSGRAPGSFDAERRWANRQSTMRLFARLLVGLRGVVPLVWIGAAVAATLVLPSLGATGIAALDDLVAQGGHAERQQQ